MLWIHEEGEQLPRDRRRTHSIVSHDVGVEAHGAPNAVPGSVFR